LSRIACWMSGRSPITRMPVLSSFVVVSMPAAKSPSSSAAGVDDSGVAGRNEDAAQSIADLPAVGDAGHLHGRGRQRRSASSRTMAATYRPVRG
jgi:hypothetical protein